MHVAMFPASSISPSPPSSQRATERSATKATATSVHLMVGWVGGWQMCVSGYRGRTKRSMQRWVARGEKRKKKVSIVLKPNAFSYSVNS